MSWDVYLRDDRNHIEGSWNLTFNYAPMFRLALERLGCENLDDKEGKWSYRLHNCEGPTGAQFIAEIIKTMDAEPDAFRCVSSPIRATHTDLRAILVEMRDRVPEWPTKWEVYG